MHDQRRRPLVLPLVLIVAAVTAVAALIVAAERASRRDAAGSGLAAVERVEAATEPIASEAGVFRTRIGQLAIGLAAGRDRDAHPRTLRTYRSLREYPGAPPRIPHGLTAEEFRTGACNTCHELGGFSPRFDAYVPVTPHPEMVACLQCHVGDDQVAGVQLPGQNAGARCRQCHAPNAVRAREVGPGWRPAEWPRLSARTPDRAPPPIPHDLYGRSNCLACHAGPSAVAEIRTRHPERANCRQCHVVPEVDAGTFVRPAAPALNRAGGAS
jgi:nitrate reductase (cytochrome), electron transfer subunit